MLNALTIDVEEYFHPAEVQASGDLDRWVLYPSRMDEQIRMVLDLLDRHQTNATFFILGWVAEKRPHIVRRILHAGHEIACHSFAHNLVYNLSPQEFRRDTRQAIRAIEDACGVTPRAYRAPSYSITERSLWALETLVECGFTHDSSIYPISHDRYGIPGFGRHSQLLQTPSGPIREIPIATVELSSKQVAPVGGGAYLRLLPYCYTAAGIRRINQEDRQPACVYFHPWEIDPEQPRIAKGLLPRLRTYTGLSAMQEKLERLLDEFSFSNLTAVYPFGAAEPVTLSRAIAG
jgi:polysaccharide deacetylase family protein (PEP-CTERM system associated)